MIGESAIMVKHQNVILFSRKGNLILFHKFHVSTYRISCEIKRHRRAKMDYCYSGRKVRDLEIENSHVCH